MSGAGARARGTHANRGFTLIELAIVTFVVALLLGSILVPLSTQVEQRRIAEAQRQLQDIKEALIGYALAQAQASLPCPDLMFPGGPYTANDGIEDVSAGGTCVSEEGNVPWATLGVGSTDPWGNRFRYRVTPGMAERAPGTPFSLSTPNGALEIVCLAAGETALPNCNPGQRTTEAPGTSNATVAVVLSHGPNGWGAMNANTGALNLPASCVNVPACGAMSGNERRNANADAADIQFVNREPSSPDSTAGEFDDIVIWLSPHTLKYRMVAAGKLP